MATPFQIEETGLELQQALDLAQTALQPADVGSAAQADAADFATAAQGGKADTAIQPNTPARFGGLIDYFEVLEDGTIRLIGNATVWDDVTPGIAAVKTSGPGVSFNTTEITLEFVTNAALNDFAYYPVQLPHRVKAGSSIFPHVHWEQASANVPNFMFQYRWQRNGNAKSTDWTNYKCIL